MDPTYPRDPDKHCGGDDCRDDLECMCSCDSCELARRREAKQADDEAAAEDAYESSRYEDEDR